MKAKLFKKFGILPLTCLATVLCTPVAPAQEAEDLPFGTWDFVINGREFGTAVINFNKEPSSLTPDFFTLDGLQITIQKGKKTHGSSGSDSSRGGSGTRGGDTGSTDAAPSSSCDTNYVGGATLFGAWTVDAKGKIVGYYYQTSRFANTTNDTFELPVSFIGIHRPGKRLNLKTANGCIITTMRGIPSGLQPDITGTWLGKGQRDGSFFADQNSFTPDFSKDALPGVFNVDIEGGGFFVSSFAIVSAQRRLSINGIRSTVDPLNTNYTIRSVSGSLNSSVTRASLKGQEGTNTITSYKLEKLSFLVP